MKNQIPVPPAPAPPVLPELWNEQKRQDKRIFLLICGVLLFLTPLVTLGGLTLGFTLFLLLPAVIALVAVMAWRPQIGLYVMAGCVVFIDQSPQLTPILTDKLYVYYWPLSLQGLIERPIGFFFLAVLFVLICRHLLKGEPFLRWGGMIIPFVLFLFCVAVDVVYGYLTGGTLKIIVVELRPLIYLFESYLIAYNLVENKGQVRGFFWLVIIGAGVKALQGIYIFIKLHGQLGSNTLMSHEESFFFVGLLLFTILLSAHYRYRPQLIAALSVTPVVVVTLVLNNRRAAYIAFAVALCVIWGLMFVTMPRKRKMLGSIGLAILVLSSGYVLLFANSTAPFALPAHGIASAIHPSATDLRDLQSNQYRTIEDFDLRYTIAHENFLVGMGFGKAYFQPIPLTTIFPGILAADPYYNYVPHNNVYWIWMRLGAIGFLAFWYLIGSIILQGSVIARRLQDRYLQMVAIYVVAMTAGEVLVAFADYQLFFYRNVIYIGILVGILMKLPEIEKNATCGT